MRGERQHQGLDSVSVQEVRVERDIPTGGDAIRRGNQFVVRVSNTRPLCYRHQSHKICSIQGGAAAEASRYVSRVPAVYRPWEGMKEF